MCHLVPDPPLRRPSVAVGRRVTRLFAADGVGCALVYALLLPRIFTTVVADMPARCFGDFRVLTEGSLLAALGSVLTAITSGAARIWSGHGAGRWWCDDPDAADQDDGGPLCKRIGVHRIGRHRHVLPRWYCRAPTAVPCRDFRSPCVADFLDSRVDDGFAVDVNHIGEDACLAFGLRCHRDVAIIERTILEEEPSMRLNRESCFGMRTKVKQPPG
jgi:hypothetical protein